MHTYMLMIRLVVPVTKISFHLDLPSKKFDTFIKIKKIMHTFDLSKKTVLRKKIIK